MYNDPNQPYQQDPNQPNQPAQPPYDPNQPYQPAYNPNQPSQPAYNPNQPSQPAYNPNQPYQPNPNQQPYPPQGFMPPAQPPKKKRSKLGIGCLAVVVLIVIVVIISVVNSGGGSSAKTATPTTTTADTTTSKPTQKSDVKSTPTPKPTEKPKPKFVTFNDGMFQVGKDIQPGTYRTRSGSLNCYYSRLSGFTGSLDEILANDNTNAPAVVTIAAGDKGFQSTGCGTWTADLSQITKSKTSFGDGEYFIGTDIEPGTYKSSGSAGCYYARLSGFGGTLDEVLDNNNTDTAAIVTIADGDKGFQSERCGTWTKM